MTTTATEKTLLRRASAFKFLLGVLLVVGAAYVPAFSLLFPGQMLVLGSLTIACAFSGFIALGFSLADLAESKGQVRVYGLLIGLGLVGLIWAVVLLDRNVARAWTKPVLQW